MVRKILVLFLFSVGVLHAYFMTESSDFYGNKTLQNFDVEASSLPSLKKELSNRYKVSHFLRVLKQGHDYIPLLSSMLKEKDVPKIFLYLAMAESNFSPNVTSNKKATGLWQFMPSTARKFGLQIDDYIDERKDPVKSTKVAIEYLKYLHKEFGKWYLAAMAYNCGEGRLRKSIRKAGSDSLEVLLDEEKKYIPLQTREYIRKIITIASFVSDKDFVLQKNSEYLLNQGSSKPFDVVKVPSGTNLSSVAKSVGISQKQLKKLNPQFRYYFVPFGKDNYDVYIPYGLKNEFAANFKAGDKFEGFYTHRVKSGDSLWSVARKYGTKVKIIKKVNNLKSAKLRLKQKLIIPVLQLKPKVYIVKKGDTLQGISKRFSIKVSQLKKENKSGKYIKPGDKIVIPSK